MWNRNKLWFRYVNNVLAADQEAAVLLTNYLQSINRGRRYVFAFDVIDLQKYKVISRPEKVRQSLANRGSTPFIFLICKN